MRKWGYIASLLTLMLAACGGPEHSIDVNVASPKHTTAESTTSTIVTAEPKASSTAMAKPTATPAVTAETSASPSAPPVPEPSSSPQPSSDLASIIPSGWVQLNKENSLAVGDLNKDGIDDVAIAIEQLQSETDGAPDRALLIAFGKGEDSYDLSIIADQVILKSDEGGVWGDPFESISVDRGSVVVSDYGGSNWRWYHDYRFRFQDDDWYLIGLTKGSYFTGSASEEDAEEWDYNLLTGDYHHRGKDENGKTVFTTGNLGKRDLIKLSDFSLEILDFED